MKFGVYEICKPIFSDLLSGTVSSKVEKSPVAFLMASVVAGAVAALLLCPMESTRIKIVTDPAYSGKGFLSAFPKLLAEEGFVSTFAGIWAMLAKQVPYTFGKQVSFDVFTSSLYSFFQSMSLEWLHPRQTKLVVSLMSAFLASLVACIFSQPGDMILTETYRPQPKGDSLSFPDVIRKIHSRDGVVSFFTGTGARIVHVGAIITSQLVVYDLVKQSLGLPATGSH